jgi:hypothetical protein
MSQKVEHEKEKVLLWAITLIVQKNLDELDIGSPTACRMKNRKVNP